MARTRGTPSKGATTSTNLPSSPDDGDRRSPARRAARVSRPRRSRTSGRLSLDRLGKLLYHLLCVSALTYPFVYIATHPNKINAAYGWHFQYLTIVTLSLTYGVFVLAVLLDVLPTSPRTAFGRTLTGGVRATKRAMLLVAAPAECLVSLIYWPIHFVDPTLLAPAELVAVFPLSADLSMHALPTLLLLVEVFALSEALDASPRTGAIIYGAFGAAYYAWVTHCASKNGWYPYPMLDLMTEPQRALTVAGATTLAFASFLALKALHAAVYGKSVTAGKKLSAKR